MNQFSLFSSQHLWAMVTLAVIYLSVLVYSRNWAGPGQRHLLARVLATALILQELSMHVYHLAARTWDYKTVLPLHLCGLSVILVAYTLITRKARIFEVIYFWGLGGAIHSILTPDLKVAFPHFLFFQFFTSHGLIILGVLFLITTTGLRPTLKGLHRVFGLTVFVALNIALINWILGSNYMFLCEKPYGTNLTVFLSEWPWYLLQLSLIALLNFYLLYLPYGIHDWVLSRRSKTVVASSS